MVQWDSQKLVSQGHESNPGTSCFSLVFIEKSINNTSKHEKKGSICFVLSRAPHIYL